MAWSSPRTWVTGETVTAAHLNAQISDNMAVLNPLDSAGATAWSPVMKGTSLDDVNGSSTGQYWRSGPLVFAELKWTSGGGGRPTGSFYVELPIESSGIAVTTAIGSLFCSDSGASANNTVGVCTINPATPDQVRFQLTGGTVTETNPFTWSTGDILTFSIWYPAA